MIAQLPEHAAPSLELKKLPELSEPAQKAEPKIRKNGSFWLIGGHIALLCTFLATLTLTSVELTVVWGLMAGLLAVSGYCYWQYFHQKLNRMRSIVLRLSEHVEQLSDKAWELREGEERHRSLVEAFGDSVMHRSADDTIIFTNDSFANIFSKPAEKLIGTKFNPQSLGMAENFPPRDQQGVVHEIGISLASGKRWYSWFDVPIRDATTGLPAIRSIVRDVTEHKKTELALMQARQKAETASNAKTRFLANVSHEMRTPLNGILGMSDLLRDTKLSPDQCTYNEAIHTSGAALLTLIEDILDITRIEANNFEWRRDEIDLAQQVEHVAELLSVRAHSKNIGLSTYISNQIPDRVIVDDGRMRQVLINLLGNAVKFTESGEVCLRVMPVGDITSKSRAKIRFEIEDTGPGISGEDKERVFGEFVQVDDENTRKHGGAGLGLAISQAIIGEMGGKIIVESDGSSGTVFSFELDLEIAAPLKPHPKPLADRHILMVSGSKHENAALAKTIEDAGGVVAKGAASEPNYNCILMDFTTTDDPVRELAEIKSNSPALSRAVILVPPEKRKNLQSYMDNGFDAFLIKPVRGDSLRKILSHDPVEQEIILPIASPKKKSPNNTAALVLLAEDNEINALLAKSILKKDGHQVCHVANGRLAVSEFEKAATEGRPFDLVLMDLHMPVMDGLDAISHISKFEQKTQMRPVRKIILSADEQSQTLLDAKIVGADDYLTKPFNPAKLIEIAREQAGSFSHPPAAK